MKKRYTEEQIVGFLREANTGRAIGKIARPSDAPFKPRSKRAHRPP